MGDVVISSADAEGKTSGGAGGGEPVSPGPGEGGRALSGEEDRSADDDAAGGFRKVTGISSELYMHSYSCGKCIHIVHVMSISESVGRVALFYPCHAPHLATPIHTNTHLMYRLCLPKTHSPIVTVLA